MKLRPRVLGWLAALGLLALLAACQRPEEAVPPAHLLPKPQLIGLLIDLHVLEARLDLSRLSPDSARALYLREQQRLFRQWKVSDSTFHRSYQYYSAHNKDLDEIYGIVIDSLTKREARAPAGPPVGATSGPAPIPSKEGKPLVK